jgi:hypothetical protein
MFINDLPNSIKNQMIMFADDVKLYKGIRTIRDCVSLQENLDALYTWSVKWQLGFNPAKCVVLRMGRNTPAFTYRMGV